LGAAGRRIQNLELLVNCPAKISCHSSDKTMTEIPDRREHITKMVVPIRLEQDGDEPLVTRSQAKRLLARVDKFRVVIFDFADVTTIGQAFADEIFRVFRNQHPEIEMTRLNASKEVEQMICRAESI
jgi:STAS-like domain of unknown function (DUF4325)